MQVSPIDTNSYSLYSPYDIADEGLSLNEIAPISNNVANEEGISSINSASGIEPTATAVAISAISPESIELQELQGNIISAYDDLKSGNISKNDFTNTLEEFGIVNTQGQTPNSSQEATAALQEENSEDILDLASAFIETVRNGSNTEDETQLSDYASLFDKINQETQSPEVNEQLQAYTQNLRY